MFDSVEKCVASLLGVSQQHGGVGVVEYGVINCRVADTHRPLHHYHLEIKRKNIWNHTFWFLFQIWDRLIDNDGDLYETYEKLTKRLKLKKNILKYIDTSLLIL